MEFWIWALFIMVLIFGLVVIRGAPYVPSHRRYTQEALSELYDLSAKDVLVDLGSGDGTVMRLAAQRGATAIGYELNPVLVLVSKILAKGNPKIITKAADFWLIDLPEDTTVVYVFSVSRDVKKLQRKLQKFADSHSRSLWLITYGSKLKHKQPVRELNAHTLYQFTPQDT